MEDCIFCKIINGDFNTEFVYENEHVVVFKDINPKAPIHLLVVPRVHVASLNELEDKNLMSELIKYPDFPCIKFKRRIVINKKKLQEWFDKNSGRFFV